MQFELLIRDIRNQNTITIYQEKEGQVELSVYETSNNVDSDELDEDEYELE